MCRATGDRRAQPRRIGPLDQMVADDRDRRLVAGTHARRPDDAHPVAERAIGGAEELLGAGERAAQAVAYPYRHRRRWRCLLPYRSEEHTSELQSLMRISYAVFCLKKKKTT